MTQQYDYSIIVNFNIGKSAVSKYLFLSSMNSFPKFTFCTYRNVSAGSSNRHNDHCKFLNARPACIMKNVNTTAHKTPAINLYFAEFISILMQLTV